MLKVSAVKAILAGAIHAFSHQLYVVHGWFGGYEAFGCNSYVTDGFSAFLAS
jgi:hypothetical protein